MTDRLTKDEATELAQRIINTMRPTPPLADWVEELVDLNTERAWRIFRSFRTERDGGLTIGAYMTAYRDDIKTERRARAGEHPPAECQLCNGTGWIEASHVEAHAPKACNGDPIVGTCHCHAVKPCRCTNAAQAQRIVEMIHGNGKD